MGRTSQSLKLSPNGQKQRIGSQLAPTGPHPARAPAWRPCDHGGMDTGLAPHAVEHRSRLADALAALYACAIAYASLQPFGDWLAPLPGTAFWLLAPWPPKVPRSDVIANTLSYIPLGAFVALIPPRSRIRRAPGMGDDRRRGALLRDGDAAVVPAAAARERDRPARQHRGALARRHARRPSTPSRRCATALRAGAAARRPARRDGRRRPRAGGDVARRAGQSRDRALRAHVRSRARRRAAGARTEPDVAATLIEAAQSAFQLLGVGLFVALLVRERSYAGGAVLVVVGIALLVKGVAAALLLKPEAMAELGVHGRARRRGRGRAAAAARGDASAPGRRSRCAPSRCSRRCWSRCSPPTCSSPCRR